MLNLGRMRKMRKCLGWWLVKWCELAYLSTADFSVMFSTSATKSVSTLTDLIMMMHNNQTTHSIYAIYAIYNLISTCLCISTKRRPLTTELDTIRQRLTARPNDTCIVLQIKTQNSLSGLNGVILCKILLVAFQRLAASKIRCILVNKILRRIEIKGITRTEHRRSQPFHS